jgi:septal ring factor EnvC (AmiA/AmiB activator)
MSTRRFRARPLLRCSLIVICSLAAALSLFAGAVAQAAAPAADAKAKAAELEQLRTRLKELRSGLAEARGRQGSVQEQLRQSEQEIGRATRELARIDQDLATGTARLTTLQDQEQTQQAVIAAQRAGLANQVRAAYLLGRQEPLKLLLNQEDPARLDRALAYYGYLNRARVARIAAVQAQVQALKTLETQIMQENSHLQELRAQQVVEAESLRNTRQERQALLAAVSAEIQDKGTQITRMEQDERGLQNLLQDLQQALADFPDTAAANSQPFARLKGQLPLPVRGRVATRFGATRGEGMPPAHGLLIEVSEGSAVRAVARGRVAFADWLRGFGLLIIIDHGGGYMSLYGHNQSLYKDTGETVTAGETIASAGASGGQAQNGVYFEIRQQGQPVDPLAWCRTGSNEQARKP